MATHIVLLIDLHPLTHLSNPTPYLTTILAASKSLLLSPSLSQSLSSFKLFFSSLSPSLSAHRLPNFSSLSFASPTETLIALSETLNSLSIDTRFSISPSRASHVAGALFQITRDHNWEKKSKNPANPSGRFSNLLEFRSNLVMLFSPIGKLGNWVSEFMNDDEDDDENGTLLGNVDSFRDKFCDIFRSVNDAYVRKDIHFSWIDVEFDEEKAEVDESMPQLHFVKSGVRSLGWGFCSTDSIILGSALIPFELIYPLFGVESNYLRLIDNCKPIRTQLMLEISGVGGEPLESNLCDLELFCLNKLHMMSVADVIKSLKLRDSENETLKHDKGTWSHFDGQIAKIQIKSVQTCDWDANENWLSDLIFVHGDYSKDTRKSSEVTSSSFFADRVLEAVSSDMGEFISSKNGPTWQLLLSFLCRNGYKALVSIIREKGDSFMAILKPFTAHLALLSIVNDGYTKETEYNPSKLTNIDGKLIESETLSAKNSLSFVDHNRNRKKRNAYKDLTWALFRKTAFEFTALELEEAYYASKFTISKKLKFLKCWMKQVKKSSNGCHTIQDNAGSCKHVVTEADVRLGTEEDSQRPNPSCFPTEPAIVQDLAAFVSCSETSQAFFNDLPRKIQHGLESEGVDLQILAERLVSLSIYWLSQKNDTCNSIESDNSKVVSDGSHGKMVADLIKILLKDPKKLKDKAKGNPGNISSASENIVREHELQIFLRMELLLSKIAKCIETSTKRKFVKQICALLEIIQYLVEGGFHGDITLYGYIEKTIKMRYFHVLDDVVNKIYVRMDLLPFGDEDHSPILLLNSEDSNHSWRDICRNESNGNYESSSGENDSFKSDVDYLQEDICKDENSRKVSGVQGRREKASRYLQRVWAPKQAKGMPVKSEAKRKQLKRKERSKRKVDVVCETPIFDEKRDASDRFASVSKALFQDD